MQGTRRIHLLITWFHSGFSKASLVKNLMVVSGSELASFLSNLDGSRSTITLAGYLMKLDVALVKIICSQG